MIMDSPPAGFEDLEGAEIFNHGHVPTEGEGAMDAHPCRTYRDAPAGMDRSGNQQTNIHYDDHCHGWGHGRPGRQTQFPAEPAYSKADNLSHGHGTRLERLLSTPLANVRQEYL